jgi:hypothetical protein
VRAYLAFFVLPLLAAARLRPGVTASWSAAAVGAYRALRAHIHGLLAINPGTVPDPGYLDAADLIVTYEGPLHGSALARTPPWLPRDRDVRLVYAAGQASALALASTQRSGFLFATSGAPPDPWSRLPAYVGAELRSPTGCA